MKQEIIQSFGKTLARTAIGYCERDPLTNIPKLARLLERNTDLPNFQNICRQGEALMKEEGNPYRSLILRVFDEIAPEVRRKFTTNFIINAGMTSPGLTKSEGAKHGVHVPWAILMDPTSACNLRCKGCWAGEYNKTDSLGFEEMDRIIREGKALGIFFYLYSGGEPLVRKDELLRLAAKHSDCMFLSFTNGTLVDSKFARDLAKAGNLALAFSVEGEGEATDFRRGEGVYAKILSAMDMLRAEGALFGFSTCYHAKNVEAVADEAYLDFMIKKGCMFGWYFTYIPCGSDAMPELITPPEKRALMFDRVRDWRERKPIFLIDFWNDGEFTNGCIAGGKSYFHINAAGDVEPCAFIHYSDVNIRKASLVEALRSPLFKAYQTGQPFNDNHLRPCPLLDNPAELRRMVLETGAHSTQPLDEENVVDLTAKCEKAAEDWAPKAEALWKKPTFPYDERKRRKEDEEKVQTSA